MFRFNIPALKFMPCGTFHEIQDRGAACSVGQNGSGKTTFIKLLCRLYDPTEGEILLNGIDIRKYKYEDYLQIFAVVFQDFQLLAFPLGQNVAGAAVYDREKAEKCLRMAGFGERLSEMPEGLDTCLYREFDKKGVEISGGEAQKIALARALYKDASFIVLDEPTAALDPLAEYEVYTNSTNSSMIKPPSISVTGSLPAGSVTKLQFLITDRLSNKAVMMRCWRRKTVNMRNFGILKRNTMPSLLWPMKRSKSGSPAKPGVV